MYLYKSLTEKWNETVGSSKINHRTSVILSRAGFPPQLKRLTQGNYHQMLWHNSSLGKKKHQPKTQLKKPQTYMVSEKTCRSKSICKSMAWGQHKLCFRSTELPQTMPTCKQEYKSTRDISWLLDHAITSSLLPLPPISKIKLGSACSHILILLQRDLPNCSSLVSSKWELG